MNFLEARKWMNLNPMKAIANKHYTYRFNPQEGIEYKANSGGWDTNRTFHEKEIDSPWQIVEEKGEITLADLERAAKLVKENSPCTCKLTGSMYCPKHNLLKISKKQQNELNQFFELAEKKTLSEDIISYDGGTGWSDKSTGRRDANYLFVGNVQTAIKEFIEVMSDGRAFPSIEAKREWNKQKAKEIFGKRLV